MNVNLTYIACFRMMRTMWRLNPRLLKQRSESTPRGPKRFKIRYGKIIVLREHVNNRLDFVEFVGSRSVSDLHKNFCGSGSRILKCLSGSGSNGVNTKQEKLH